MGASHAAGPANSDGNKWCASGLFHRLRLATVTHFGLRTGTAAGITLRPEYRMAKLLVSEKDATWVVNEHGDSNDELRRWLIRKVGPS